MPIGFEAGERDLQIRLELGGRLTAVLVVPPGAAPVVGVEDEDGDVRAPASIRRAVGDVLECVWSGLRPGSYRLTVRSGPPVDRLLWEVVEIAVTGADGQVDPRLAPIDLRDRF